MKQTVLQMTQNILSALNGDEVNSISDTTESLQVATCLQTTYFNMMSKYNLPEHNQLVQLTASTDATKPVLMTRPAGISTIDWIKYYDSNPNDGASLQTDQFGAYSHGVNTDIQGGSSAAWSTTSGSTNTIGTGSFTFTVASGITGISAGQSVIASSGPNSLSGTVTGYTGTTLVLNITSTIGSGTYSSWVIAQGGNFGPGYLDVRILPIDDFLKLTNKFDPSASNVRSFSLNIIDDSTAVTQNFTFFYKNDSQPQNCCIIGNQWVIFDSFDSTQETTLQASKTMCMGWLLPFFNLVDSFVPNLDDNMFPLLLNEAKSLAFFELKQMPHQKAEQEVKRQLSSIQKFKAVVNKPSYFAQLPDFGRRGSGKI